MDRILVTGGSGFIGSFLVERLVKEGHTVRIFDNNFRGRLDYLSSVTGKVEFFKGDITDLKAVTKAMKGIDTVYHLAAINGTEYFYSIPDRVVSVNTKGTINMVDSLAGSDAKKFVFFSSSEVYGKPEHYPTKEEHKLVVEDSRNPRFTYSGSKIIGEIYTHAFCKKLGIDYSIVRPHNFYGPRMGYEHVIPQFIRRVLKKEKFTVQGDGSQTRSFCYITDAVDALYEMGKRKTSGEIFNVGNDKEEYSVLELITIIEKVMGVKINPSFVPLPEGGTLRRQPDISKARRLLDFDPKVTLEEGVRLTYKWYKEDFGANKK